jgi:hypothetical protein
VKDRSALLRAAHSASQGRLRWPSTNGSRSCSRIFQIPSSDGSAAACERTKAEAMSGESTIPSRFEAAAEVTVPATLP